MEWKTEPLGDIAFMTSGGTPSSKISAYYENGTIPWVRSGELENGAIRDTEIKITQAGLDNSSAKIFPRGTLLIALYGATIGKLAYLDIDACTNQAVCGMFENDKVSLKYLYYFLLFHRPDLVKQGVGGAQSNISQTILKKLMVYYPVDKTEQLRIVARIEELFSELDNGVETLRKTKQQLAVYRQAVLKDAFGRAGEKELQLKQIIEKPRYGTSKKCSYDTDEHTIPVYRIPNINYQQGTISHDDLKYATFSQDEFDSLRLCEGDILIIRSNGSVSLVGRSAVVTEEDTHGLFAGYLMRLRIKDGVEILPQYLNLYLNTHYARWQIEQMAKSTSGVNNINSDEICRINLPVCDVELQEEIIQEIESRLSVCDSIEKTVDTALQQAEAMRQSILKQAFEKGEG